MTEISFKPLFGDAKSFFYFHPAILPRTDKIFKYNSHLLEIPINQRYFGNRLL